MCGHSYYRELFTLWFWEDLIANYNDVVKIINQIIQWQEIFMKNHIYIINAKN